MSYDNPARAEVVCGLLSNEHRIFLSTTTMSHDPLSNVLAALERLAEHDVGVLVVLEGGRPAGVFSERDLARKVELRGRTARDTPVRDVMTPEVLYVTPGHTLDPTDIKSWAAMQDQHGVPMPHFTHEDVHRWALEGHSRLN